MMRRKMIAANWKMNLLQKDIASYFQIFNTELGANFTKFQMQMDMVFALPNLFLEKAIKIASPLGLDIYAQNFCYQEKGAFTGETSLAMLSEIGISSSLIGHSERRHLFLEDEQSVGQKVKAILAQGGKAILCVGESLAERKAEKTAFVLERQLLSALTLCPDIKNLAIAYEPCWAIGTGLAATPKEIQEAHAFIRKIIVQVKGQEWGQKIRILYGGSVNEKNIGEIFGILDVDGALVGGASLDPAGFAQLVKLCAKEIRD